ncbi:MAG: DUF6176 family protein [Dehalococcoidia bacterium]
METQCVKIRLRPDSLERVRAWAEEMNRRRDEALATLVDEGVYVESVFLDRAGDGDFLIYYMKAESFGRATAAVQRSPHAIDAYHQQFKRDTWVSGQRLELLVDLTRPIPE